MTLYRALRGDRLLLVLTVVLTLAAWAPLLVTPFLPFADLPNNAAAASMLLDAATGRGVVGYHYHVNQAPAFYWTSYAFMAAASAAGGVLFAAKAIVALLAALLPLSVMRLLCALRRSPRLGLWAFALSWDHSLYRGWITFLLGMAMALYVVARLIEMESRRDAIRIVPWSMLVALTHPQALAFLAVAGVALALLGRPRGRSLALHAAALSGAAVVALPWVAGHLAGGGNDARIPFSFEWHPLATRAARLFAYTLDHYPRQPAVWAPAFAFAVMLLGPALLAGVRRDEAGRGRDRAAAVVVCSCLLLYALLPYDIRGPVAHHHNYPRYATFALLGLLLVPRPDLRGWRALLLLPGVVAALAMDVTTAAQLRRFAEGSRPFLEIMGAVPRGARVLPLINVEADPACAVDPYNQFHAYLTAAAHGYDPYLFDHDGNPLRYTVSHQPVVPPWTVATERLSLDKHASELDFILVQGLERDPFQPGGRLAHTVDGPASDPGRVRVHPVAERAIWRLYAVVQPPPR